LSRRRRRIFGRPAAGWPAVEELTSEELWALDAYLDALVAPESVPVPAGVDTGMAAVARRLGRLPAATWDVAAPFYETPFYETPSFVAAVDGPTADDGPADDRRPTRRRLARPPAAVAWATTAAAAIAILTVVGINTFSGQPPTRPVTGVSAVPASWRLAGFIDQMAWRPSSSGAVAASVAATCPTVTTCYADDLGGSQAGAVVEVTTDGGSTWQAAPLPPGAWLTSNLVCPTAGRCLAAGYADVPIGATSPAGGTPAVFVTDDDGSDWSTALLPSQAVDVVSLACRSATACVGASYGPPTSASPQGSTVSVQTTDGGGSWSVTALPGGVIPSRPYGASCVGAGDCVVVGTTGFGTTPAGSSTASGAALYSDDGGASWSAAAVPAGIAIVRAVSCSAAADCMAVANGPSSTSAAAAGAGPYGPSTVLVSTDGGRSWTAPGARGLAPAELTTIACPSTLGCWAGGFTSGTGDNGSEVGVIESTHDGGATWSTETLPTRASPAQQASTGLVALDIEDVSSISCPADASCLAMAAQGASTAPTQQHLALHN
jgi:BNR/Asp-box repeat protein